MRKVGKAYSIPPWELLDVPEDELAAEAEMLDVEDEIVKQLREQMEKR